MQKMYQNKMRVFERQLKKLKTLKLEYDELMNTWKAYILKEVERFCRKRSITVKSIVTTSSYAYILENGVYIQMFDDPTLVIIINGIEFSFEKMDHNIYSINVNVGTEAQLGDISELYDVLAVHRHRFSEYIRTEEEVSAFHKRMEANEIEYFYAKHGYLLIAWAYKDIFDRCIRKALWNTINGG